MGSSFFSTAAVVVPSDVATGNFIRPTDAIYVGGAGIVQAVMMDDITVPFTAVAGEILPIRCKRIATTSTATLMNALYMI